MFKMGREKRGTLALELWARQLTDGYPNVSVDNMTTSWRNGLAFCALIHRFRPDLIDYDKLEPSDIMGNCSLAFETAESKLGIPALLDPEDMAAHEVPDRLSVLTYVAQFYSLFKNAEKKSTMPMTRRQKDDVDLKTRSSDKSTTPSSEKTSLSPSTAPTSTSSVSAAKRRFEFPSDDPAERAKRSALLTPPPCSKCQNPVYISERTVFLKKLYHRKCFRCHGCASMLNPHTADVSADGSSFFCLAKSCQLELLKHNRGGSGGGGIASNSFLSSSTSSPSSITDPSLLVRTSNRSSFLGKTINDNNDQHENNQVGSTNPSPQPTTTLTDKRDNESKENVVPLRNKESENVVGGKGGRVSRLTARFECVQNDDSSKIGFSYQEHIVDKSDDREVTSDTTSIISSRPTDNVELPGGSLVNVRDPDKDNNTSSSIISQVCDDDKDVEMSPLEDSLVKNHSEEENSKGPVSILDSARSNWLLGQIVTKEEKETVDGNDLNENVPQNIQKSKIDIDIPTVVVSQEMDSSNVNEEGNNVNAISIKFKLSDDKEPQEMDDEENIGDSGISGISIIDNNTPTMMTSEKTEDAVAQEGEQSVEESKTVAQSPPVPVVENNFQEVEADTHKESEGTLTSSSVIRDPNPEDNLSMEEPLEACEKIELDKENIENVTDSENPFEEDEEEKKVDQANEEKGEKTEPPLSEQDSVVAEVNNATSQEAESPEPSKIVSTFVPSPVPPLSVEEQPQTERLTPTPRKKKKAPQPSPLLLQQASASSLPSAEPARPMPSPRTRSKFSSPRHSRLSLSTKEEYPVELNPFGDEETPTLPPKSSPIPKPRPTSSLPPAGANPFEDEEDDATISVHPDNTITIEDSTNLSRNSSSSALKTLEINNNGKGGTDPPKPTPRSSTPKPAHNPFDEDDDIGSYEDDKPTGIFARGSHDDTSSISSKTSDLSNTSGITGGSHQKSFNAGDISSLSGSTKLRPRKTRRAPLPPGMGPSSASTSANLSLTEPLPAINTSCSDQPSLISPPSPKKIIPVSPELKVIKNANKVQYRKKRRAPPPRRRVEPLPEDQIKTELSDLEIKQKELERQGISLEGTIRQLMCQEDEAEASEENLDSNNSNGEQMDEMIIQLWNIVNEKNDILRRQTELEYLRRSHRLEEMQAELEFQLRILMDTPEDQRLDNHATTEQLLLDELLKLVDERNEVVDWLDYYRQMDREEEMQVSKSIISFKTHGISDMVSHLKLKSGKKDKKKEDKDKSKGSTSSSSKSSKNSKDDAPESSSSKPLKKKESFKSGKLGIFGTLRKKSSKSKSKVIDEDKDVDESIDK